MSNMTGCLNDLSYIPPNNEQNEPTQGDIDETSNEPNQAIRNEFEELYVSANEELYPGCDYVTRLDFMAKFTYFKVKGKLTDSIFNEMLEFLQNVFPTTKGYKLPPSYYAIKKTFKMIGLGYESIHACVNDCFLFWGKDHKDKQFSLVCNTSRWKDNNTSGKKVPKKVLCYFPIIPRLQCLYKSSYTTKEMTWHATRKCTKPESSFMLTLLIPGPKSPGKDIDVYLSPLNDDLKDLWAKLGVETIDVATGQKFNMRAMVLWTINDFPARSSLFGWSGQEASQWRRSLDFNGEIEDGDPPRKFDWVDIMVQLARLPTCVKDVMHIEKNVLESILNTLLMNDKSKDTTKARQDLKRLGIRSGLWLGQNKNGKCTKPQAAYSFTPGDRKKFCQFIKGVKLPDGFGSNFKHKVTDNDTNITGLKSHDSQIKVVDIMCNLELIYPPGFFDIMIHLVIHLPLEALEGGPIRRWWMYPFERFMKKLKNYVPNKAKPEGLIAKGYVAEEAFAFSSHYFLDVFKSACKSIGLRSVIDHQELKKVIWYILHNSPEIDTYRVKFKSQFPNKDMKEEFLGWFGSQDDPDIIHVDNSSALAFTTSLNELEIEALHIDGQSIDVDVPPDIIDVNEDDDIIDDEDVLPHELVDSDDEDLVNVDDDDGVAVVYSTNVARGHGGDGGGDNRPPPHELAGTCRGKGTRKPNLGGKKASRMHTRKETRNLRLRKITDELGRHSDPV
ncbi:hypothetical protein Tco_0401058 [Tanacetum coccineum]